MDLTVVDSAWAEAFGVAPIDEPGVQVIVDAPWLRDYPGSFILSFGDRCLVTTPSSRESKVRSRLEGRDPREVFTADLALSLGEPGWVTVGPSQHHYIDAATFRGTDERGARPLGPQDAQAIESFRATVGEHDWAEGGFGPDAEILWGIDDDDGLVAMGNLTEFLGRRADIGVATHPAHRGRGLAMAITAAMTRAALTEHPLVSYRALFTNAASLRVASKLGFVAHGANIAVRPPREQRPLSSV